MLQVPEQWEAVENEILVHRQIKHKNVMQLVESEMKGSREGQGMALLIFPFYRVRFFLAMKVPIAIPDTFRD